MMFWSSDKLTGSQTNAVYEEFGTGFWSSDKLTGSQTTAFTPSSWPAFWSSDKLTGSQTLVGLHTSNLGFGAVTN